MYYSTKYATIFKYKSGDPSINEKNTKLLSKFGLIYKKLGQIKTTLNYHDQALKIQLQIIGENHNDTVFSLNCISEIYRTLGDIKMSWKYNRQAKTIELNLLDQYN